MTTLYKNSAGEWLELTPVPESQRRELPTASPERRAEITASARRPVNAEAAMAADAVLSKHTPQDATLIDCTLSMPAGRGIINCRVGGQHTQIRF